ncbi:hypothetical protein PILCRDRAFT_821413 [Piloderma croceum F 1598]|uniref:Uncharacterized protein n=1 Tax=Piloderma croceum (strain F 1598) TaxID=765440 RepID=A0A0C3B603_PILCF|nr:hypothetical protein PILCRDRAFT_821413 [Piloderma croceum F 1598]
MEKNNKHHVGLHLQNNLSIYAAISLTVISTGSNTTPALTFKASYGSNMHGYRRVITNTQNRQPSGNHIQTQ